MHIHIIDSTLGGNINAVFETIDLFEKNKYSFHLRIMVVPAFLSKLSILLRFKTQLLEKSNARWTRFEDHDNRFDRLPTTLHEILIRKPPQSLGFYIRCLDRPNLETKSLKREGFYVKPFEIQEIISKFNKLRTSIFVEESNNMEEQENMILSFEKVKDLMYTKFLQI